MTVTVKIGGADVPVNLTEEQANEVKEQIKATIVEETTTPQHPDRLDFFLESFTRQVVDTLCREKSVDMFCEEEWDELNEVLCSFPYNTPSTDNVDELAEVFANGDITNNIRTAAIDIINDRNKVYTIEKAFTGAVSIRVLASSEDEALDYVDNLDFTELQYYLYLNYSIDWDNYSECSDEDDDVDCYDEDAR